MITNLNDLYLHQLKDLYSAETQAIEGLQKLSAKATDDELVNALDKHISETRGQLERLQKLFANHGLPVQQEKCKAAEGILREADELLSELSGDAVNAGVIAAAQRFEHYEIAAYGTAKQYAKHLDFDDDVKLLDETLDEESDANEGLTKLAVGAFLGLGEGVNENAMATTES